MRKNIFDIILNIIIVLLSILVVYWLIKLLFGGSPELSEFNFAAIILLTSFFIKLYREVGEIKMNIEHVSTGIRESFNKIKEDINLIKNKLKI